MANTHYSRSPTLINPWPTHIIVVHQRLDGSFGPSHVHTHVYTPVYARAHAQTRKRTHAQ